jgi:sugar/nucleoside kinase (ribokinase family)
LADGCLDRVFLLTDGAMAARRLQIAQGKLEERLFQLPPLPWVLNPNGAGDTVTAGLAHYLLSGLPVDEAFRRALAMGSASCLQLEPAAYSDQDYERIQREIL